MLGSIPRLLLVVLDTYAYIFYNVLPYWAPPNLTRVGVRPTLESRRGGREATIRKKN